MLVVDGHRCPQSPSSVARRRLDPNVVKWPLAQDPSVADTVQCYSAGQTEVVEAGLPKFLEDGADRVIDVTGKTIIPGFIDMHSHFFREYRGITPMNAFEDYAATIGLDVGDFASCLDSDRFADVVSANMRLGIELGVSATPTIFVSRGGGMGVRVNRWNEVDAFKTVIDRLLEEDAGDGP